MPSLCKKADVSDPYDYEHYTYTKDIPYTDRYSFSRYLYEFHVQGRTDPVYAGGTLELQLNVEGTLTLYHSHIWIEASCNELCVKKGLS